MRIGVQTWGSDGDVRPLLALAAGLVAAGHDVLLSITSADGKDYGAAASALGVALRQAEYDRMSADEVRAFGRALLRSRSPMADLALVVERLLAPSDAAVEAEARALCGTCDLVVGHAIVHALAAHAEKAAVPWISVQLAPDGLPTRHAPPGTLPNLGRFANALLWRVAAAATNGAMLRWANAVRARAGVAPSRSYLREAGSSRRLNLVAASPTLVPAQPDWPRRHVVCGALELPERGQPETLTPALEAFVSDGPAPVYLTVGSMAGVEENEGALAALFADAARRAGHRAIVQASPCALDAIPDSPSVFRTTGTPHAAIFPRCAAVVHHGGAGTSHAAARAGVPSVVVPYYLDQGAWGATLCRAGVAPKPLPRAKLTAKRLAARLARTLGDARMADVARTLGARMRDEDGVARAVSLIGMQVSA